MIPINNIVNVTPGLLPIPPNGWGAIEKIIWEIHQNLLNLGYNSQIKYLDDVTFEDDIVHIHVANLANMAHERGIPYYFTFHDHHAYVYGKDSDLYKENLKAIKNAKKAFVPAKYLVDYFEGIPQYLSHGVNTDFFKPSEFREHKLLCVANNGFAYNQSEDRKGFGLAIEAAKILNLPITIAGPINNKKFFDVNNFDYDKLTILYDLSEERLRELYKEHTIFLHPSVIEAGHPNLTILEAMASGLPVIGTFEPNNNLHGMMKIERNLDQLVDSIIHLLDEKNYLPLKLQALETASNKSWLSITNKLIIEYTKNKITMKELLKYYYDSTKINVKKSLENKPVFNINFINGPFFEYKEGPYKKLHVQFINKKTGVVEHSGDIEKNCWIRANKSYFVDWLIKINNGNSIHEYNISLENKKVYIALDSKSLGDTLAWFPQVEEFRKKHNCILVCSTFHNYFFEKNYPNIEFVKPGDIVHNLYAMYTIGWFYNSDSTVDYFKIPNDFKKMPLQKTASDILGLDYKEVVPLLNLNEDIKRENIVSIAVHSTAQSKYWNNPTGWQEVVDFLKEKGYRVILLSNEGNGYMGNWYPNGIEIQEPGSLENVIQTLQKSKLFIGLGSGLSWLSWATKTKTCLISGFSEPYSEFETNIIRISAPEGSCKGCFNEYRLDAGDWNWCPVHKGTNRQFECSKLIKSDIVIEAISPFL